MIYQPQVPFNVQLAVTQAFIAALARLAADYITGSGKPWAYYLGYGLGGAALATGIPGANAVLYGIGAGTVELFFEKSPGAADVQILLDGIGEADLSLNDEIIDVISYVVNIPNDGAYHAVSVLNLGTPEGVDDPTDWLSLLQVITSGATKLAPKETVPVPVFIVSATIKDAKTVSTSRVKNVQSVGIYVPQGALTLAEMTGYHDAFITALDAVTDGQIIGSSITIYPALPTVKSAPVAGSDVQEGGLINFLLSDGQNTDGVRVPAYKQSLFGTDGQSIPNSGATATFVTLLTGGAADPNDFPASNQYGITLDSFNRGRKSFRK